MQIVIDVPEEVYNRFGYEYREENLISKYTNDAILDAFCKGTPLPKGHGRLIDADALLRKHPEFDTYPFPSTTIDNAPTIIEADVGSEDT